MTNHQDKISEFKLRQSIVAAIVFFICMEGLFALPELFRRSIPIDYNRAALIIAIGFGVGMAISVWLTRLLQSRTRGSLVIPVKSWHLNIGLGIPLLLWTGVPALLSRSCRSLLEKAIESRTASTAAMDCLVNTWMVARFEDGVILGLLIWTYLWAVAQERSRKGQLIIAVHSRARWSVRGWPVTNTVMVVGFGLFLIYIFYRIFTLR